MGKYDYLGEMQVRFANPRLKEFILESCNSKDCGVNSELKDKRFCFGDYLSRMALACAHRTHLRVEEMLKINKIPGSKFAIHYDTSVMQIMTWVRFSVDSRSVDETVNGEMTQNDDPNSFNSCLGLFTAMSHLMVTELMCSGNESGSSESIDFLVKSKIDRAYEKNQELLVRCVKANVDCKVIFADTLMKANLENSKESLLFALERWELSSSDKKQITEKINETLTKQDESLIRLIMFKALEMMEPEIDSLYEEARKCYSKVLGEAC